MKIKVSAHTGLGLLSEAMSASSSSVALPAGGGGGGGEAAGGATLIGRLLTAVEVRE